MSTVTRSGSIRAFVALLGAIWCVYAPGCASIRITDPPRTATEQFLLSVAATEAVDQLSAIPLRDRAVYVDSAYLTGSLTPANEYAFLLGEIRAKLLGLGVRLVEQREQADIIVEVRAGALGIDRNEFLIGIPSIAEATPELAILKNTKQRGYASVAFVAYWRDTGELVGASGPFTGKTFREDFWIFGVNSSTIGDIPSAQR